MSNVDKYKYVTIIDNDETVLPPKLNPIHDHDQLIKRLYTNSFDTHVKVKAFGQSLNCNRFNSIGNLNKKTNSPIENYIDYLNNVTLLANPMSYNFEQVFFLKMEIVAIFFRKFYFRFINSTSRNSTNQYPIKININNLNKIDKKGLEDFEYTFLIRNEYDFNYTRNLFYLNRWLIKPFLKQHQSIINKACDRYDRVFGLANNFNNSENDYGKTIHNTQTTFTFTVHQPYESAFVRIPFNHGYLSHFRGDFHLRKEKKPIAINQLFIDFNYFVCYFKPIVHSLKTLK